MDVYYCDDKFAQCPLHAHICGLAKYWGKSIANLLELPQPYAQPQIYRKTSSISRTKFQSLNVSCVLLQLSSLNPLKPGVKLRMKM